MADIPRHKMGSRQGSPQWSSYQTSDAPRKRIRTPVGAQITRNLIVLVLDENVYSLNYSTRHWQFR